MFSDLPGIDPDFDSVSRGQYRGQTLHGSYGPRLLKAPPDSYGRSVGPYQNYYPPFMQVPLIVPTENCDRARYWSSEYPNQDSKSSWYQSEQEMQLLPDKYSSYPATMRLRDHASPSASSMDGSTSDDGSNHTSSQWGVEPMGNNAFGHTRHPLPVSPASPMSSSDAPHYGAGGQCAYPGAAPGGCSSSYTDPCIKMEDIQQYPDSYVGDHFDDQNDQDGQPTGLGTLTLKNETCPDPEDHALTPGSIKSLSDDGKEESVDGDKEDDTSDYSPRSRKRSKPLRRARFRNHTQNSNKSLGKLPKLSGSGRIGKRPQRKRCGTDTTLCASSRIACPHCSQLVHSKASLNKHIATAHTRPFSCTFQEYGCTSTFGSKNEWKRHVSSQHLRPGYWRCQLGRCYPQYTSDGSEEEELIFNDFNRKDLFMQHLRRMHAPHASSSAADRAAFSASLDNIAHECFVAVRGTPPRTTCGYCAAGEGRAQIFQGKGAWEARMEHVGRHLESGHGEGTAWSKDCDLERWLIEEGLIEGSDSGGWRLVGLAAEDRSRRR